MSNMKIIARNIHDETKSVDISDAYSIDFGEGDNKISIMTKSLKDDRIQVRTVTGDLIIKPKAANSIEIISS